MHLSTFQAGSLVAILVTSLIGGYYPLFHRDTVDKEGGLPLGEAFASGVFLALAVMMMLPNGEHLFHLADPQQTYPMAHLLTATAFLSLLALAHIMEQNQRVGSSIIPIVMTVMIAIPSFLLGTALGVSTSLSAVVIAVAIMAHKGSAGFALALAMVRSSLTQTQAVLIYLLFAFSTPTGILVGAAVHADLTGPSVLMIKAIVLSLAAGVFLFMATLHELKEAPMISYCNSLKGFSFMVAGFVLTALVRLALGIAHTGHLPDHWK